MTTMVNANANANNEYVKLKFESFEDLQMRLMLLPRVAATGVGAIIEAFTFPSLADDDDDDDDDEGSAVAEDVVLEETPSFESIELEPEDLKGYYLLGFDDHDEESQRGDGWKDREFVEILATIRQAPTPIVLCFAAPSSLSSSSPSSVESDHNRVVNEYTDLSEGAEEEKKMEVADQTSSSETNWASDNRTGGASTAVSESDETDSASTPQQAESSSSSSSLPNHQKSTSLLGDLSSWTTRMKATSAQLASGAASLATAAKERHAAAMSINGSAAWEIKNSTNTAAQSEQQQTAAMFLHTSSGAWLPLRSTTTNASSELRLTNSSVLSVRLSATQPCPTKGYSFQWYRSCRSSSEKQSKPDNNWTLLQGANHAVFQPSATEVGYRLRCILQTDKVDEESTEKNPANIVCESGEMVIAALPLFNGSIQALAARQAQFGGFIGRGKATGRSFRLKIEIARVRDAAGLDSATTSAVTIYQVSGRTAEPMHPEDEPILGVSARCDYSHAKSFYLVFAGGIPHTAAMVSALATDNCLELQAPNRLARESLLLAIGIANYVGKRVDLDASTILYDDLPDTLLQSENSTESSDDAHDSVSCASSGGSENVCTEQEPTRKLPERPPLSDSGIHKRSISFESCRSLPSTADATLRTRELEQEVKLLREKLARKDKVVSELQRCVARSESCAISSEKKLAACEEACRKQEEEKGGIQLALSLAEKRFVTQEDALQRMRNDHDSKVASLENQMALQNNKIAELEKNVRTLQNEKALLSAAVEARESKLSKMADLQVSFDEVSKRVKEQDMIGEELEEVNKRYREKCAEMGNVCKSKMDLEAELERTRSQVAKVTERLDKEKSKTVSHQTELEAQQMRIQKLIAERNSYKQKGDSLSKEMGRICRNGRTIRDVEKILADDASRRQEVELLREQKRKALDDLQHYRTAYEQSLMVQRMAGVDHESSRLLERNAELERLLSELTEYVNAKEMQLETMKQVNEALQTEIRDLAKANMSKNDV